ncbi:germination protein YpeB [Oscillospiraceae bacterium OttesenSCG-928-G22]|nr:germination protein YpeB [Oscillospiraceae bacterium OttesenSCG-928-G22]
MKFLRNMKRRTLIRIVSFTFAAFLVVGGVAVSGWMTAYHLRWNIEKGYQQSFADLVDSVTLIDTTLQKGLYSNSPVMYSALSSEISRQSALASASLSSLPFSNIELEKTAKFIAQAGDFAYYMSKKAAAGEEATDEEKESLQTLSQTAGSLARNLNALFENMNEGQLRLGEIEEAEKKEQQNEEAINQIGDSLKDIETEFAEYAGLIYDGPFSDHIQDQTMKMTEGAEPVTAEDAIAKTSRVFGVDTSLLEVQSEPTESNPVYSIGAALDGGEFNCEVMQQGGYILMMTNSRTVSTASLDPQGCIEKGKEFMNFLGLDTMTESYYTDLGNIVTINFAYKQDDLLCYPDLVKVSIAKDNGDIVGFETRGYLTNHTERKLPEIKVAKDAAQEKLSPNLNPVDYQLVVIPSAGKHERFCHEFKCESEDGQTYLVYVNVETGVEEQIFILTFGDNGVLTI